MDRVYFKRWNTFPLEKNDMSTARTFPLQNVHSEMLSGCRLLPGPPRPQLLHSLWDDSCFQPLKAALVTRTTRQPIHQVRNPKQSKVKGFLSSSHCPHRPQISPNLTSIITKSELEAGEMTQCLRALAALPEALGLVPRTQGAAHSHAGHLMLSSSLLGHQAYTWYTDAHAVKITTYVKLIN